MVDYYLLTNQGERDYNEDYVDMKEIDGKYCFLLADGLGGHGHGELASECVVSNGLKVFEQFHNEPEWQRNLFTISQDKLLALQEERNEPRGMKTTMVLLSIEDGVAEYMHVGDSRGYVFSNGEYLFRTRDHSVPQMLAKSGEITEDEIRHHPDRNRLIRVMGSEWDKPMQEKSQEVSLDDGNKYAFLLCTDGWWDWITEPEMADCLKKAKSAKEWMDLMLEIVLENGTGNGMDNYSAITVIIKPDKAKAKSTTSASSSSGSSKKTNKSKKSGNPVPIIIAIICALIVIGGAVFLITFLAKKKAAQEDSSMSEMISGQENGSGLPFDVKEFPSDENTNAPEPAETSENVESPAAAENGDGSEDPEDIASPQSTSETEGTSEDKEEPSVEKTSEEQEPKAEEKTEKDDSENAPATRE